MAHMDQALNPEECEFMRAKLRQLVNLSKCGQGDINDWLRAIRLEESGQVNNCSYNTHPVICLYCGKVTTSNRGRQFCNESCSQKYLRRVRKRLNDKTSIV